MKAKPYSKELQVAHKIAHMAGNIMLSYVDDLQLSTKSDNHPLTIADTKISDLVIQELKKAFPKDGIIGEEKSTSTYGMGRKWMCDPIDGTAGYIWGTPTATFCISCIEDGKPVLGVIYDPFLKHMFWAVKGQGSYCNKSKLAVSNQGLIDNYVGITDSIPFLMSLTYVDALRKEGARPAIFSGAAYKATLVARGRFVGFTDPGLKPYDVASMQIIVEEAGGKVTGLNGEDLDYSQHFLGAVVSNGKVHKRLVEIINS